ncbi:MAG: ABC transporter ATP-binding protein [Bacteroidota bacterium]
MNGDKNTQRELSPAGLPGRHARITAEKPGNARRVVARLWQYIRRQKSNVVVILFLSLVNISASVGGSYLLRPIINNYVMPHNISGLIRMVIALVLIYLTGSVAAIWQNRLMIIVSQRTVAQLRTDLFSKLQSLPLRFFDTNSHGDLMSRFSNDVDTISETLNTGVLQLLTSSLTLLGTFTLMIYISPLLTLVTLVITPLMLWIASRIIRKSKTYFVSQQQAIGSIDGYVQEMISGQKVVKVFDYQKHGAAMFETLNYDLRNKATNAQLYSGVMLPVIQNLNTINFALTAVVGGVLAVVQRLDIGGLAAFLQYSRQFGRPINEISSQYSILQQGLAGAERVFQVIDQLPESLDQPGAKALEEIKGHVRFTDVTFGYDPGQVVLSNISFEAKPGQKITFVGSTGAGKSTIMNLLPRFYDIQSGRITIDGIDLKDIRRQSLRESMAIVLQDTHLFTATVMENVRYGNQRASDDEVIDACKLAGAHSFIMRLSQGYQTLLEDDGRNLSQGQRQLLNIARAAVAKPVILILDEATSSIDTRSEQIIQRGMDHLMVGRTSFVIAHRLSTVRNADEILVLEHGAIIERGNHEALLRLKKRYYELHTTQFD